MKPTRIGGASDDSEIKNLSVHHIASPTKISGESPSSKPTSMPTSEPAARIAISPTAIKSEPATTQRITAPSSIPGKVRKRIPIDKAELMRRHGSCAEIIDAAMEIITAFNEDTFAMADALLWGQTLQAKHGALVSETLTLAKSETVAVVSGHLNRLMTILEQIELEKIFGGQRNMVAQMIRKASERIDTPDELDQALREIDQLSKLLQGRIEDLLILRSKMEQNSSEIERTGNEIESSMIAAQTIAEFLVTISRPDFAACLEERVASLTVTLGHIRTSSSMRKSHIEQPMNLTTLVQDIVFNTLLSWMTSVIALRMTLHGHNKTNPTEVSEISRIMQNIQQKLRHT
jgi:hypothetical protein